MTDFEILKQEIQSWYSDYIFQDEELDKAVMDLIKFFEMAALSIYETQNNSVQTENNSLKSNK